MMRWPLLAASLTVSPMEPRLLPVTMLGEAYKAIGNPDFLNNLEVMMNPELVDKIATAVAAKMATPPAIEKPTAEAAAKALETDALIEAVSVGVMMKLGEMPAIKAAGFLKPLPKSEGPFFNKLPKDMDNVKAFNLMLHFGEHRLSDAVKSLLVFDDGARGREVPDGVKAALNVTTAGQGGYLVPVEYSKEFIKSLAEQSYLRQAKASHMMFPEALTFKIPGLTFGAAAALTSEGAAFDQVEPTTSEITFQAYKYTRLSKASDELVDDSRFDLWTEVLSPDWVQAFAAAENTAFTTGTGSAQPQGVVTGAGTGKTTTSATAITADEIIDLFFSLNHLYREHPSAAFMMNDSIFQYISKLKDGEGRYLVNQDLARGFPATLLGKPIILNNSMASTVATTNKTILFGAFDYFKIADRSSKQDGKLSGTEIYVRRLNELYAASGQVGFRAFSRFDSHVLLAAAFKLLVQA
jgi:HK97 family phage major capsid protein